MAINNNKKFCIGIDLGWKDKRTTGVCILEGEKGGGIILIKDVLGKNLLKTVGPYLENTKAIAIDAPLTRGKGKGKMRLYEKFLSTGVFRQAKVNPTPPALMSKFHNFAVETTEELAERGFVLGVNLIETFPVLVRKICKENFCKAKKSFENENQHSAFLCAKIAFLHSQFKTRWLGYKDGFLFLPETTFWGKGWREKFFRVWKNRPRLKYYRLVSNIFNP